MAAPVLEQSFSARGGSYEEALSNARNTVYHFEQQDSVLKFPRRLEILNNELWRNQEVFLTLKVPLNTKLVIDHVVNTFINNLVDITECNEMNQRDQNLPGTFVMTDTGLECFAGPNAKLTETHTDAETNNPDTVIRRTDTIIIRK